MHLYFARNRQLRDEQNTKQIITLHIAIDMIYTNIELYQWLRIYAQKNVCSIISVNC